MRIIWDKTFGKNNFSECGSSVKETSDKGYIVVGTSHSSTGGYLSVYLVKTDVNGDTMWTKQYAGSAFSVQQTLDEGYIITGSIYGVNDEDVLLLKTNSHGNAIWSKTYDRGYLDQGLSVQQTVDGGFIVVGSTHAVDTGSDVYLIRTDNQGDTLWTKTYGSSGSDAGNSIQKVSDGNYIVVGFTDDRKSAWLLKIALNGDTLWTKKYSSQPSVWEEGFSVVETSDGAYVVSGFTTSYGAGGSDLYLVKLRIGK